MREYNYEIEELIEKILLITSVDSKTKNINAKLRRELSRLYHDGFVHGQLSILSKEEKQELRAKLFYYEKEKHKNNKEKLR